MLAAELIKPEELEVVDIDTPEPGYDEVLIEVESCGVCHSDIHTFNHGHPDIEYPTVLGHEIVGTITEVGDGVDNWNINDRVGVGWHGGHCSECPECQRGNIIGCESALTPGISYRGGFAEYTAIPSEALAKLPDGTDSATLAPLMCGGAVMYDAINKNTTSDDTRIGIEGIGGLGHIGIQIADAKGYETVALSRTPEKEKMARELGADQFVSLNVDGKKETLSEQVSLDILVVTIPDSNLSAERIRSLRTDGRLLLIGIDGNPNNDRMTVSRRSLIDKQLSLQGWLSGPPSTIEETVSFCLRNDVSPITETYPVSKIQEAIKRVRNNNSRYRTVIEFNK